MKTVARLTVCASLMLAAAGARAVSIDADTWTTFDFYDDIESAAWVDLDLAPMSFEFVLTGPAVLRVVDGGLAGDRFEVKANGVVLGTTSPERIAALRSDAQARGALLALEASAMPADELFDVAGELQGVLNLLSSLGVDVIEVVTIPD